MRKFETDSPTTSLEMSNCDGSISPGLADVLIAGEGVARAHHYAWNFCGRVWYEAGRFHEQVSVYGAVREEFDAESLEALMTKVNDEYGHD